jgi:hypothetical protein
VVHQLFDVLAVLALAALLAVLALFVVEVVEVVAGAGARLQVVLEALLELVALGLARAALGRSGSVLVDVDPAGLPTATALAATAYSRIKAQPTTQATNSSRSS